MIWFFLWQVAAMTAWRYLHLGSSSSLPPCFIGHVRLPPSKEVSATLVPMTASKPNRQRIALKVVARKRPGTGKIQLQLTAPAL